MNKQAADLLDRHLDIAFAAPDGIKRLREFILTIAMQGKLTPQDPSDPPASELLKKIEAEKKRLVKEGKRKAPEPLPAIKVEEMPQRLPEGWRWVRLDEIADYNGRDNVGPESISSDTWLLDLEDIEKETYGSYTGRNIQNVNQNQLNRHFRSGTFFMASFDLILIKWL